MTLPWPRNTPGADVVQLSEQLIDRLGDLLADRGAATVSAKQEVIDAVFMTLISVMGDLRVEDAIRYLEIRCGNLFGHLPNRRVHVRDAVRRT